jgi:hypothetical protein
MSRPSRVPERGDVSAFAIAQRLGVHVSELELYRSELERRGFPPPDPTTGRYCIEAVDRWRLRRYPRLFPELTGSPGAVDARSVSEERLKAMEARGG